MIGLLIGVSILTSRAVKLNTQPQNVMTLTDNDVPMDLPMTSQERTVFGRRWRRR